MKYELIQQNIKELREKLEKLSYEDLLAKEKEYTDENLVEWTTEVIVRQLAYFLALETKPETMNRSKDYIEKLKLTIDIMERTLIEMSQRNKDTVTLEELALWGIVPS